MIGRLRARGAIRRGMGCAAGAVLLLFATSQPHGAAADDTYSATVTVDATADNVAKARDKARLDGQRKAFDAVVAHLSSSVDTSKLAKLSDSQITDLVASFEVANEKMTAVRYTADYTYHFRPSAVQGLLAGAGGSAAPPNAGPSPPAAAAQTAAKPTVVLPVLQTGGAALLWGDPNPWRLAWTHRAGAGGGHLVVPAGEIGDVTAIDADKARTGDPAGLAAIAKKYDADEVLVMLAAQRSGDRPGLDITVKRYRAGQFVDVHFDSIDANPGEKDSDLFRRAADTVGADIDGGWKNVKPPPGPAGNLVASLPINGLDDWLRLRGQLSALPSVKKLDLQSLSRQQATVALQYVGNLDQLKGDLATINLSLEGGDPTWRLARSGPDHP